MSKDYRIYQEGDRQIIERLTYPRFKGVITFNSPLSDIEVTGKAKKQTANKETVN